MFKNTKMLTVILILVTAILFFTWGIISAHYKIFPFQQLRQALAFVTGKDLDEKDSFFQQAYWKDRISIFSSSQATAKIIMIGDSITDHTEWHELFPGVSILNRGINGDTTLGVAHRLESIIATTPDTTFIMLGINDIAHNMPVEDILKNYIFIITELKAHNINPIIQSTLYVSGKFENSQQLNPKVKQLNTLLKDYADKNGLIYIDLNELMSSNEALRDDLTNDGIHINGAGYQLWKIAIEKYI